MSQIQPSLNVLKKLGITQWRLRTPLAAAAEEGVDGVHESGSNQPILKTPNIERNGELDGKSYDEPYGEPYGELHDESDAQSRNQEIEAHQDLVESHTDIDRESVSQEHPEPKSASNTNVDSTLESEIAKQSVPNQPSEIAQTSASSQKDQQQASPLPKALQPDSLLNKGKKAGQSWSTLESDFKQRTHCGENLGLTSLPSVSQREAPCAIILPPPSPHDVELQQAQSESSSRLLGEILRTLGISPAEIYLTNAIKCAGSALNEEPCAEWIHTELELLSAKICIVFGESAARAVLKTNLSMDVLRKSLQPHPFLSTQCIVTHSLEELLAKPELKQESWQDLKAAAVLLQRL